MNIAVAGATGRVGHHLVDVLAAGGHDIVAMSRSSGVDVTTGVGLAEALTGVECVVDVASGASPDQQEATDFFTAAARSLHEAGEPAGVRRMVVVSIIGCDRRRRDGNPRAVAVAVLAHVPRRAESADFRSDLPLTGVVSRRTHGLSENRIGRATP